MQLDSTYSYRTKSGALAFPVILRHFNEFRRVPACRELAKLLGWASHNNAAEVLRRLIADGLLVKVETPGGRPMLVPVGVKVKNLQRKRSKKSGKSNRCTDGTV